MFGQVRVRCPGRHRERLQQAGDERRRRGDGAVQRPAARRPHPDRHLQRGAQHRLRRRGHLLLGRAERESEGITTEHVQSCDEIHTTIGFVNKLL